MQRNIVFGSDPEVFRPERWLEQDEERIAEMDKVHSIIFSYGGSKCLGVKIAHTILNKLFVEVSRTLALPAIGILILPFPLSSFYDDLICHGVESLSFVRDYLSPDILCERASCSVYSPGRFRASVDEDRDKAWVLIVTCLTCLSLKCAKNDCKPKTARSSGIGSSEIR